MNSEVEGQLDEQPPGSVSFCPDEHMGTLIVTSAEKGAGDSASTPAPGVELAEGSIVSMDDKNGYPSVEVGVSFGNHEKDASVLALSGVKRPRLTVDDKQPSVHVIYKSLPRDSIKKLGEVLQQWSQWHSQKYPSSDKENLLLESGEETHYPALRVGMDKPCAVTFWVDDKLKTNLSKDLAANDGASVPLYDRGFSAALASADGSGSSEGGLQNLDSFRCFNCGSYSHGLKDCPRPRDTTAVNNARKVHKSRRNQNRNSQNLTRYYQGSHRGKYDGLRPGAFDAETKKALGLGEFDPPPWLNRMREIGYPPGYLDHEEDQPSGISIFDDEMDLEEAGEEEGEIHDESPPKPFSNKKMTVEFPGVNAPIPEDADQKLWAPPTPSSRRRNDTSTENSHSRRNHWEPQWNESYQEPTRLRWGAVNHDNSSRLSHHRRHYSDRRWHRDLEEDLPPGCDPGMSPSLSTRYLG